MPLQWIDATFLRGGTSKGLFFRETDLPPAGPERDRLFLRALGSPDPFGRQLDGMGGGLSSLSKVVVVRESGEPGVGLEYTFGQAAIRDAVMDYSGNCGNLSAAVVPFALGAGLLALDDGDRAVVVSNTNTGKQIRVRLAVTGGVAATEGPLAIPGVAGTGAPIELEYLAPGGARTGTLLPDGAARSVLRVDGREYPATLVDAAIPMVVVAAADLRVTGAETPGELDADTGLQALLDGLRRAGAVAMGLAERPEAAALAVPKIAIVAPPRAMSTIDGAEVPAAEVDVVVRTISMGQTHRAIPGTAALAVAVAARLPGSLVADAVGGPGAPGPDGPRPAGGADLRIGTPSGVVTARAVVTATPSGPHAESASLLRTARPLMRGQVAVPRF
ncbi:PrpF domain-containing protein [Tsukamurella paurometabola]|uniref:3-methylitaconate isomerase n=1 Tax=Tsukamurella paurometabola TaxID=2061 RepID=A0A3P8KR47_TSUPA|nr:PrpF domain-containing protein [Tsukamurella paurometabola]UEA81821.1 acetylornithine aminotransferase [Tsukamurella paurometabola]VDR38837.1 3-methylitaconate isomerase [Tsukamurella paurometabola]